jgi:TolB-like protein
LRKGAPLVSVLALAAAVLGMVAYIGFEPLRRLAVAGDETPAASPSATPVASAAGTPSIAVLPFLNMSDDEDQEFFVDGLTEDLIIDLSSLSGLFVISRNSSFTYKDRTVRPQEVAADLGVAYVLNGSVRRAADQLRITAQLVEAASDRQVWSGRYDRKLTDVFAVQDEVKKEIVAALQVTLRPEEKVQVAAGAAPTKNIEAYEFYLRGRYAINLGTNRATQLAYYAFDRAIELDPNFAEAHAAQAMTYATDLAGNEWSWNYWVRPPGRARVQAEALARKAEALNPALAYPQLALARLALAEWRFEDATAHARRAIELEPGNAEAHAMLARALTANGDHHTALTEIEQSMRNDPKPSPSTLQVQAIIYFGLRDYQRAAEIFALYYGKAVDGGDWIANAFDLATSFYAGDKESLARAASRDYWGTNLSAVRFGKFYRKESDIQHLLDGLRGAGVPEYDPTLGLYRQPTEPVIGPALAALLTGRSFEALCATPRLNGTFQFTADGTMGWTMRHDLADSGAMRLHDDRICVTMPALTRNREACYTVLKAKGVAFLFQDYPYALAGPNLCYLKSAR